MFGPLFPPASLLAREVDCLFRGVPSRHFHKNLLIFQWIYLKRSARVGWRIDCS